MSPTSPSNTPFIVYKGVLRPATDGVAAASDELVVCGRGAFETLAAYRGRPFLAPAHLARLRRAARVLDLPCPSDGVLLKAMATLLEANGLAEMEKSRLRLTLSSPADGSESWWIEATAPPPHPEKAKLITGSFVRNERSALAGLKTVNYGDNVVAQRLARKAGADEALFSNTRDELCEGTWSNIFVKKDGQWITPPLDSGCLAGVTRALVLELGLDILESTLSMHELVRVESAFLTSSLREIQPVAAIDGREMVLAPELAVLSGVYRTRTALT